MAANFQIVSQRQTREVSADGRIVDVMDVTFITPDGTTASERIPLAAYSPDYVNAVVSNRAAQIEAVAQL